MKSNTPIGGIAKKLPAAIAIAAVAAMLAGCPSNGSGGAGGATYTVTYNANGATAGSAPNDTTRYAAGTTVRAAANSGGLRRDGYPFFIGWNTTPDGNGDEYVSGTTFSMPDRDLTLYALWLEVDKPTAADIGVDDDAFGFSTAVSDDYAFIGSLRDDDEGMNAGAVYVFQRLGVNDWSHVAKLTAPNGSAGALFGFSVAADGDYLVVGAAGVGGNTGAAYIFRRTGPTSWDAGIEINHPDNDPNNEFGASVAIDGDYVVVGAPGDNSDDGGAFVFRRIGTNSWSAGVELFGDQDSGEDVAFGASVGIDGEYAVVGAPSDDEGTVFNSGEVLVFRRTGTNTWSSSDRTRLVATDGAQEWANFGGSVAIDGDLIVVGASGAASNNGATYVFHLTGVNAWTGAVLTASNGADGDSFGGAVSIGDDIIAVGAPFAGGGGSSAPGAVYILRRDGSDWDETAILTVSDADPFLGRSLAVGAGAIVVGAPGEDDPGTARIWRYR